MILHHSALVLDKLYYLVVFNFHYNVVFVSSVRVARFRFSTWPQAAFLRQLMPTKELSGPCVCLQIR